MAAKKVKDLGEKVLPDGTCFEYLGQEYVFVSAWGDSIWAKKPGDENPNRVYPLDIRPQAFLELELVK